MKRGEVWLVGLDPTVGSEIQKSRPCLIVSEPVRVTKYGRETVYIVSAQTFHEMKRVQR